MGDKTRIGIVGAGITGLATAFVLCENGYTVTIVARDIPGDINHEWASPWAGAVFHPQVTSSIINQDMQRRSFEVYSSLVNDPKSGVELFPMTEYFNDDDDDNDIPSLWYSDLMPGFRDLSTTSLPSGVSRGVQYTTLAMNPTILLPYLNNRILDTNRATFIKKSVTSLEEVSRFIEADIIVNATGVGARWIVPDEAVMAVRGQTILLQGLRYQECFMREGKSEYTYVIPRARSNDVIIGGVRSGPDRTDSEPDNHVRNDILTRVQRITGGAAGPFGNIDLTSTMVKDIVGFRPGRKGGLRVERVGDVIHAYGAEGAGYIYSFGVAARVKDLIEGTTGKVSA